MPDILKGTIKDSNGNSLYPITSIDNVINLQSALDGKASSTHVHGNITNDGKLNGGANKVVVTDGNKFISVSTISTTELGYLSGVTSNIQTQLNGKAPSSDLSNYLPLTGGTLSGNLTLNNNISIYSKDNNNTTRNVLRLNTSNQLLFGDSNISQITAYNNLIPYTTDTYNLGASTLQWNNIYGKTLYENGTSLAGKYLQKLTYEWNKQISFGNSGYLLIGKFPMYDSNITIDIDSTTNTTYHGTLVIATQNINTTRGGTFVCNVYGDANNTVTGSFKVQYSSGSNKFNIYFAPSSWSKNLIHIRAVALQAAPNESEICTNVSTIPTTDLCTITNVLTSTYLKLTGGTLSSSNADILSIKRTVANSGAFIYYYNNNQTTNYWTTGMFGDGTFGLSYKGNHRIDIDTSGNLILNNEALIKGKTSDGSASYQLIRLTSANNVVVNGDNVGNTYLGGQSITPVNARAGIADLGDSTHEWRNLYLSGTIRKDNASYGLSLPTMSSWTKNEKIAIQSEVLNTVVGEIATSSTRTTLKFSLKRIESQA